MGKKNSGTIGRRFRGWGLAAAGLLIILSPAARVEAQDGYVIRTLFELGQRAYDEGRYQDAVNYFEEVIERNNSFAWAYHALGLVYQEISTDPYYPLWYFQTAVEVDPKFAPAYDVLCRSYYQLQNYKEAEVVCLRALELDPDLLSSQISLAWVYLIGRSDANRALHYFELAINKVNTPFMYFGMGMAYAMRGEHGKVLEIVTRLRSDGMEDFAVHLEAVLRSRTPQPQFMPPGVIQDEPEVQDQAQTDSGPLPLDAQGRQFVPVPVPVVVVPSSLTGNPEVQIRGKITPPQVRISGSIDPVPQGGQKDRHPGGLSQ